MANPSFILRSSAKTPQGCVAITRIRKGTLLGLPDPNNLFAIAMQAYIHVRSNFRAISQLMDLTRTNSVLWRVPDRWSIPVRAR
jgi:hypothetical protein